MLVLDASTAIQASLSAGGFAPLGDEELVAPRLLWSEGVSALHELSWRGAIPAEVGAEAVRRLLAAPVRNHDDDALARKAFEVADALGWAKTYDAEYVALAQLLGCRLVTIDERLRRGASRLITVVAPADV